MIDLTPLEVRQKKADFPKGLRGYEPGHVDDFLDLVADRLEALVKDNRRLGQEMAELRSSAGEYKDREKALTEALVSAQQMREEVREQATKEAALMRREAEHEAERVRDEALRAIEKEEETLRRLRARQRQLVEGYRTMLERELRELAVVTESLDTAEPAIVAAQPAVAEHATAASASDEADPAASAEDEAELAASAEGAADVEAASESEAPAEAFDEAPTVAPAAGAEVLMEDDEPEADADDDDPWVVAPPPAAPRAEPDRSLAGERWTAPAASLDPPTARGLPAQEPRADPKGSSKGGDEPDWLAAILKED